MLSLQFLTCLSVFFYKRFVEFRLYIQAYIATVSISDFDDCFRTSSECISGNGY